MPPNRQCQSNGGISATCDNQYKTEQMSTMMMMMMQIDHRQLRRLQSTITQQTRHVSSSSSSSLCTYSRKTKLSTDFQFLFNQPIFRRLLQVKPGPSKASKGWILLKQDYYRPDVFPVSHLMQQSQGAEDETVINNLHFDTSVQ